MKLSILGATGSIGTQALEVVDELRGSKDITVVGLTGGKNIKLLEAQIRKYRPKIAAVPEEADAQELRIRTADTDCQILCGEEGLCAVATEASVDMVLAAIVGFAGLVPTMRAIEAGKDIALANKETLVTAGNLFMQAVKKHGVRLLPVDSEHSAIFQCLAGGRREEVRKIWLTASGGPFFGMCRDELAGVTKQAALQHPNWNMGAKITIDSATMMNKGLEILEACHLFQVSIEDITVVVHRESIIHSMVEFVDHSVLAQMALPSMKQPIQYTFTYPERLAAKAAPISFAEIGKMTFYSPDEEAFPCLALAKQAGTIGGLMPTVLNAANEAAVAKFLREEIRFLEIAEEVQRAMEDFSNIAEPTLAQIIETDKKVRIEMQK